MQYLTERMIRDYLFVGAEENGPNNQTALAFNGGDVLVINPPSNVTNNRSFWIKGWISKDDPKRVEWNALPASIRDYAVDQINQAYRPYFDQELRDGRAYADIVWELLMAKGNVFRITDRETYDEINEDIVGNSPAVTERQLALEF